MRASALNSIGRSACTSQHSLLKPRRRRGLVSGRGAAGTGGSRRSAMTVERDGGGGVGGGLPDPPASAPRVGPVTVTVRTVAECDHDSIVEALALARSLRAF